MFEYSEFMPHGHCFLWLPEILWTTVISDLVIALSYFTIPLALLYFSLKSKRVRSRSVLMLFGAFIFLCGVTHSISIYTIWVPNYALAAVLKFLTAAASGLTALVIWIKMPMALKIPSPAELEEKNTELRELNSQLEEKVEVRVKKIKRLASIVNQSTDAILSTNAIEKITSWNTSCERVFQFSRTEILGSSVVHLVHPSSLHTLKKIRSSVLNGKSYGPVEIRGVRKDGTFMDLSLSVFPLFDQSGKIIGSSSIARDISENKKLNRILRKKTLELKKINRQLEKTNKSKDEFLSNVSHELKTPLGIISGFVDILDRCRDDETRVNMAIDGIRRNITSQSYLVHDLIDVSRIGSKKFSLNLQTANIYDILQASLETVDFSARRKNIDISLDISIQNKFITCDQRRLQQILWNLLSNAVKFTPSGGRIDLKVFQVDDSFVFEVIDSGKGLTSEDITSVFNRLWQSNSNTESEAVGMGLGLTITKELVRSHGGKIDVTSSGLGKGSKFSFNIPQNFRSEKPISDTPPTKSLAAQ